ncbi:hypothetical protein [Egbenema bharatensis]|uniref:hypothetical protein n=1 Tax=Egbenema bharatensis TaxID=3463334 RepID=UPI003A8388F5
MFLAFPDRDVYRNICAIGLIGLIGIDRVRDMQQNNAPRRGTLLCALTADFFKDWDAI